jgi:hypothetical protein
VIVRDRVACWTQHDTSRPAARHAVGRQAIQQIVITIDVKAG